MRIAASLLLIGWGTSALAQPVPTLDPDPIVVTGLRDGSSVGMVDFDKVWRRCAECKRALDKLAALSKPYHVKKGEITRDAEAYVDSVTTHARDARQAERFLERLPDIQRRETDEMVTLRFDMEKLEINAGSHFPGKVLLHQIDCPDQGAKVTVFT